MHPAPIGIDRRPAPAMLVLLASLYCARGLPSGLFAHSLPVLLRQYGVDLGMIGLLKLLALPWMPKALWAPWVDRIASHRLGHHRGWILPLQATVILCIAGLAFFSPPALFSTQWPLLIILILLINLAVATQDIATDGLTVRRLSERWRGLGNGVQVSGYKLGMIVSGSGLLFALDSLGWNLSLSLIACLLLLCTLPIWRFAEQQVIPHQPAAAESARGPGLLWAHYRGLLAQPGMLAWMAVVLSFKLGEALGSPMVKPMLVDQGWRNGALGQLTLIGSIAGIGGALLGGSLYIRLGAQRSLLLFGALQAPGIAAMALLVNRGGDTGLVYLVVLAEQMADGMSAVALFAVMMQRCRPEHEGADFTFQASAQASLAGFVGAASGLLAQVIGYVPLFVGAEALGAKVLAFAVHYCRHVASPPNRTA